MLQLMPLRLGRAFSCLFKVLENMIVIRNFFVPASHHKEKVDDITLGLPTNKGS